MKKYISDAIKRLRTELFKTQNYDPMSITGQELEPYS